LLAQRLTLIATALLLEKMGVEFAGGGGFGRAGLLDGKRLLE